MQVIIFFTSIDNAWMLLVDTLKHSNGNALDNISAFDRGSHCINCESYSRRRKRRLFYTVFQARTGTGVFFTQKIESEISDEAGKKIENFRLVVIKIVVNWVLRVEEDGVCVFVRACVSFGRCLDVHIVSCRPVSLPISFIMVAVVAVVVAITVPVPSH